MPEGKCLSHPEIDHAGCAGTPPDANSAHTELSFGESEMGRRVRSFAWEATPLGPIGGWSPSLRMIVRFLLGNRIPMLLWWGPEFIQIYNDAYRPVLGVKHPSPGLGHSVKDCWSEIWHVLRPLIETPFGGGEATWVEDILLEIKRHGFLEESHFTIAYSPVPDDTAPRGIGGVLATVHEITQKVVGERRVAALRDLGARLSAAKTPEEVCQVAAKTLTAHDKDVPFALLYLLDADEKSARLAASAGVRPGDELSPRVIDLDGPASPWPLARAGQRRAVQVVERLGLTFRSVPPGPWTDPPDTAAVVPIQSSKSGELAGFFVAGVSARLRFDEAYQGFLELATGQIASAIANARAYQDEKRRAEALAELDRAKTVFFSNVSHEFRTPLTLMLGPVAELLGRADAELAPSAKGQLEIVGRNGRRLLRLVNTLLDFSRIEAGRAQATYQETDLAAFTADLASVFRSAMERAGLRLTVDCNPLIRPVFVDREMWEKIVHNLLSNALKFTFEGEVAVRLREEGDDVLLTVADTGTGIPAEEMPRLFERFHRVHNAHGRTHEGSGIGLALVHELVKLHGGRVEAVSEMGKGTTFAVRLKTGAGHLPKEQIAQPRAPSPARAGANAFVEEALRWLPDDASMEARLVEPPTATERTPGPGAPAATPPRGAPVVLVADDNADMREYIARLLEGRYRVVTASDGREALDAALADPPEVVLTDVMMPRLDGLGLMRALRADGRTSSIPVIVLSARAGEESRVEGMESGADDYIVKPFSAREVLARVDGHVKLARLRREAAAELREREERFRALVTASWNVVYRVSADWAEMRQLQGKEFIADTLEPSRGWMDRYIHADDQAQVAGAIRRAVETKSTFELEHRVLRPDGTLGWTHSRAVPILDDRGEIVEWFGAASDITARRQAQEQLAESARLLEARVADRTAALEDSHRRLRIAERMASLGTLAAGLGHDMANLLLPIRVRLESLEALALPEDGARDLAGIRDAIDYLRKLSRGLRHLAIDPSLVVNRLPTEIIAWWAEASGVLKSCLPPGVLLDAELPASECWVAMPTGPLTQAVFNLVQNAGDAMRQLGSGAVKVSVAPGSDAVSLVIADTGPGMSDDVKRRCTEPFFSTKTRDISTGLGLTLVYELVQQWGGTIGFDSQPGRGTVFTLSLKPGASARRASEESPRLASPEFAGRGAPTPPRGQEEIAHGSPTGRLPPIQQRVRGLVHGRGADRPAR